MWYHTDCKRIVVSGNTQIVRGLVVGFLNDIISDSKHTWARGYQTFSCSTQLRLKFFLLINVKVPTIVGILRFISRINHRLC